MSKEFEREEVRVEHSKLIKKALKDEFYIRAKRGKTSYSMEEVLWIVTELIDDVDRGVLHCLIDDDLDGSSRKSEFMKSMEDYEKWMKEFRRHLDDCK